LNLHAVTKFNKARYLDYFSEERSGLIGGFYGEM